MLAKHLPRVPLGIFPTPIQPLNRLSDLLGGPRIWIKRDDLTGFGGGGNKVRKLEFALGDALQTGRDTIITCGGPQSNHARQTAAAAAHMGLRCLLALPGEPPEVLNGNLLLDHLFGAEVCWVGNQGLAEAMESIACRVSTSGGRPYVIPLGASNEIGAAGYAVAMAELLDQARVAGLTFDRIVLPSGSGGTQAGLIVGAHALGYAGQVLGISVYKDSLGLKPFLAELVESTTRLLHCQPPTEAMAVRDEYIGEGYAIMSEAAKEAILLSARCEGLLLDPVYTGKAMAGLIDLIRRRDIPADETVLFWHTGGSPALFAYAAELVQEVEGGTRWLPRQAAGPVSS